MALFLVMQVVLCILQCENQVCLKILTMLLIEGYSNAEAGLILMDANARSKKVHCKEYLSRIQNIINKKIRGDEFDPLHWECPMNESGDTIGSITLSNSRAQEIVSNLEELIDLSIATDEQREQYKFAMQKFKVGSCEDFFP